jgi:hypothetical protein
VSAPTFADGQRVRCIDATESYGWLTDDAEYTIRATISDEDGELVQLVEHPDGRNDEGYPLHEWAADRFEAVR